MQKFTFAAPEMPESAHALRLEVRRFLEAEIAAGSFTPTVGAMAAFSPGFSVKCGERGWLGMTWPRQYGGHERSALERYVVVEEMLAFGAPVMAHWIADRQSGPQILRHGSERAKREILPRIAAGRCTFAIGMSEPDTGSDLASVKTKAIRTNEGWRVTGRKVWTSYAHRAHYLIALVRTSGKPEDRHAGLSQLIIDTSTPGITIRPIVNITGQHEFNEVTFDEVLVPDDMIVGAEGEGWKMVTSELAFERSGPDRYLSTFPLLVAAVRELGPHMDRTAAAEIGRLVAHIATFRRMSGSIAGLLEKGEQPVTEAALVKDLGTTFEQSIPEIVRRLAPATPRFASVGEAHSYEELLGLAQLQSPCYSLRGGTREILRGMVARGLGLR